MNKSLDIEERISISGEGKGYWKKKDGTKVPIESLSESELRNFYDIALWKVYRQSVEVRVWQILHTLLEKEMIDRGIEVPNGSDKETEALNALDRKEKEIFSP